MRVRDRAQNFTDEQIIQLIHREILSYLHDCAIAKRNTGHNPMNYTEMAEFIYNMLNDRGVIISDHTNAR